MWIGWYGMGSQIAPSKTLSFEEFIEQYAGRRYEYVDGRAVPMGPETVDAEGGTSVTPTKSGHGLLVEEIAFLVGRFAREHKLGRVFGAETGFLMRQEPPELRAADIAFYSREGLKAITRGDWLPFPPALAVEVISEHDRAADLRRKARDYMESGTRLLWLVYPTLAQIEVYTPGEPVRVLGEGDTLDGGDVLPGFSVAVGAIFAALDDLGEGD